MALTEKIFNLKIHNLSENRYKQELENNNNDTAALYLIPTGEPPSFGELNVNGTSIEATKESDIVLFEGANDLPDAVPINISASDKTVSFSVNHASTDTPGVVQLASSASEDTTTAITPTGVSQALGALSFEAPLTEGETVNFKFIDSVTQEDGKVYATKKAIPYANEELSGIVKLSNDGTSTAEDIAVTPYAAQQSIEAASQRTSANIMNSAQALLTTT